MIENIDTTSLAGSLAAALTGIASVAFLLRKKLSEDNADIARNRAEESIINSLEKQRDFALSEKDRMEQKFRDAYTEKDEAVLKVSKLTIELENLSGQVKILRQLIERLGSMLDTTKEQLTQCMHENARLRAEVQRMNPNDQRDQ